MKRIIHALFLLAGALALSFVLYFVIQGSEGSSQASKPVSTRQVLPQSGTDQTPGGNMAGESQSEVSHIPAQPNEVILNVISFNTDQEEGDEQVLTVRKTDRSDGRLYIVVADYNSQKKEWFRAWEAETLTTKLTTFSVIAKDLVGDHNPCLVCTGIDDQGAQTMVVFRKPSAQAAYAEVYSSAADSIQIAETDRSEAYQQGQASADPWPIFSYSSDKLSSNVLDQIKDRYAWDARSGKYLKTGSDHISGAQVERATIAKILTGSAKDFESFLQGVWYESDKSPSDPGTRLILFDREGGTISFYKSKSQEVFRWVESHATHYGLYIRGQNESIEDLVRLMDIELTGSEQVALRISEDYQFKSDPDDRWDGSYKKLPREAAEKLPGALIGADSGKSGQSGDAAAKGLASASFLLEGPYRASSGMEVNFASPRYSLKAGAETAESGNFELFMLGDQAVLDLISLKPDGSRAARKTYRAVYAESHEGKDLVRKLVLSPAHAAIDGLELTQEDDIILFQRVKG